MRPSSPGGHRASVLSAGDDDRVAGPPRRRRRALVHAPPPLPPARRPPGGRRRIAAGHGLGARGLGPGRRRRARARRLAPAAGAVAAARRSGHRPGGPGGPRRRARWSRRRPVVPLGPAPRRGLRRVTGVDLRPRDDRRVVRRGRRTAGDADRVPRGDPPHPGHRGLPADVRGADRGADPGHPGDARVRSPARRDDLLRPARPRGLPRRRVRRRRHGGDRGVRGGRRGDHPRGARRPRPRPHLPALRRPVPGRGLGGRLGGRDVRGDPGLGRRAARARRGAPRPRGARAVPARGRRPRALALLLLRARARRAPARRRRPAEPPDPPAGHRRDRRRGRGRRLRRRRFLVVRGLRAGDGPVLPGGRVRPPAPVRVLGVGQPRRAAAGARPGRRRGPAARGLASARRAARPAGPRRGGADRHRRRRPLGALEVRGRADSGCPSRSGSCPSPPCCRARRRAGGCSPRPPWRS